MSEIKELVSKLDNIKSGKNFTIVQPVNLYDCEFGDNCFVGPFVEVQSNVKVGDNTRISSHTFLCSNTIIGEGCFIGHGVVFVNHLFKNNIRAGDQKKFLKTVVGKNVNIGSNATIFPVKICDNVTIGAGAVVTKDIDKSGSYIGNPAKLNTLYK
ncbi:N-acetyltransferase [Candidatus Pelagibacter sp.]|nr:N-acetyltransferase [Candidatus Pelagibacter sp.]